MKVAALVSGGKDSCYALGLAQGAGHAVVALLNLCPADPAAEDTDSHCFQTVAHGAVPALAAATGLPLLVRRLTGGSTATGMGYDTPIRGDEVEDLAALLLAAVAAFPGLEGVVSGAVASDYQRLRVEHAAARAGLMALAPLWHVPQLTLLADMERDGLDAVLVKVAAEGLDPDRWCGQRLAAAVPHLTRLAGSLGLNPAGEGGEYETLTLDCPAFRRGRLRLLGGTPTAVGGGAGVLAGLAVEVEVMDGSIAAGEVTWVNDDAPPPEQAKVAHGTPALLPPVFTAGTRSAASGGTVQAWATVPVGPGVAPEAAAAAALAATAANLAAAGVPGGLAACSHIRLYLPTMASFDAVNAAWKAALPGPGPPARACLAPAAAGPAAPAVILDAVAPLNTTARRVLHVQTTSPWAPACIGPYAQGVADGGVGGRGRSGATGTAPPPPPPFPLLRLAGQIGLDPASMALVPSPDQPARALASAAAVGVAMGADLASLTLGWTLLGAGEEGSLAALGAAFEAWSNAGEGEDDPWAASSSSSACSDGYLGGGGGGGGGRWGDARTGTYTDSYLLAAASPARPVRPVTIFIAAGGLPRGAVAEVEALAVAPDWVGGAPAVPGWVGSLERVDEESATHCLAGVYAPGGFAHLAVGVRAAGGDTPAVDALLTAAATHALTALDRAGLAPVDVGLARAFVRADLMGDAEGEARLAAALATAWHGAGLAGPPPVVVPVCAVGLGPGAGEKVVFEVTAGRGGGGAGQK